jgi:antitoxin YefM
MSAISYSEARERMASVWDEVISTREAVVIERRGHESVVLVPLGEWEDLLETVHLLRSPANANRLLAAMCRLESGEGEVLSAAELGAKSELR